jgi:hypothetical protein
MQADLDERMASQFEGNFLDAADLMASGTKTVTISDVSPPGAERDSTRKVIDKPIVSFEKTAKRLILNKTNAKVIAMAHGKKASQWIGKKITLTVRWLDKAFGETNVPVIRVVPPAGKELTFGMRKRYGAERSFGKQPEENPPPSKGRQQDSRIDHDERLAKAIEAATTMEQLDSLEAEINRLWTEGVFNGSDVLDLLGQRRTELER